MLHESQDDDKELLTAQVSFSNAPHIPPHNRGKRAVLIALYQDHFLWADDRNTVGFLRICSEENQVHDLIYVPDRFVGQDLASADHYLLDYICPATGMTVQQEIQQVLPRTPARGVNTGRFALGCLRFFVDRLVLDSLHVICNSRNPGYYDVFTGNKWFDAPIKRHHLHIRSVGDLRRAGLLKSSCRQAAV